MHKCFLTSSRRPELPHPSGPNLQIGRHCLEIRPHRLNTFLEKSYFSFRSTLFAPHMVHCTYYSEPSIWHRNLPIVYTAYDMIHEKWGAQLDPSGRIKDEKLRCFERATVIPCISESTRCDLLALYPHLEHKTSVIHLAGDLKSHARDCHTSSLQAATSSYLLYVGARASYKNFIRLLFALARVSSKYSWIRLKVVGAPLESHEVDLVKSLGLEERVVSLPNVADDELYSLYNGALAFIYPSLYEGFGIPLLEAMALNCPVLASDVSSIPEVTGDSAILFNPYSVESISEAILQLVSRPSLRYELIQKGQRRYQDFSWDKTAAGYLELYERLLQAHA